MIPTSVLRAMQAAGATAEMILAAIEADEKANAEGKAKRREQNRINQQNHRARQQESALTCDDERLHALTADDAVPLSIVNKDSFLLTSSDSTLEKKEEVVVARESKPRASRGQRLPEDWKPNVGHIAAGKQLGFSENQISEQAQDMRIWANANGHRPVARKSDWDMTFLGWLRRNKPKQNQLRPVENDQLKRIEQFREERKTAVVFATDVPGGIPGIR